MVGFIVYFVLLFKQRDMVLFLGRSLWKWSMEMREMGIKKNTELFALEIILSKLIFLERRLFSPLLKSLY